MIYANPETANLTGSHELPCERCSQPVALERSDAVDPVVYVGRCGTCGRPHIVDLVARRGAAEQAFRGRPVLTWGELRRQLIDTHRELQVHALEVGPAGETIIRRFDVVEISASLGRDIHFVLRESLHDAT